MTHSVTIYQSDSSVPIAKSLQEGVIHLASRLVQHLEGKTQSSKASLRFYKDRKTMLLLLKVGLKIELFHRFP